MQSNDLTFWLGLALAIPLSILGNLATPWFQQKLSRRSQESTKERIDQLLKELSDLEELASNPHILMIDLLREMLIIVFLTAASGVLFGAMSWIANAIQPFSIWLRILPLIPIVVGVMIAKFAMDAALKARNVRHLDKHSVVIKRRLKELGHRED